MTVYVRDSRLEALQRIIGALPMSQRIAAVSEAKRQQPLEVDSASDVLPINHDWRERVPAVFPQYFYRPFSEPHEDVWDWANNISINSAPLPFCAIWPRGRGKSTNGEGIVADTGVREVRNYWMYVSRTQDQADKHVAAIAAMLSLESVARYNPRLGKPHIGQNGNRTWNRKIVRTQSGFAVEAIGLDKSSRGSKIDWHRPDGIAFDDIDQRHDKLATTLKIIQTITETIMPAGAPNVAILFLQNLIFNGSVAHRLSLREGEFAADFLLDRIVSGPYKSAEKLTYDHVQREDGGYTFKVKEPTRSLWRGFSNEDIEREINRWGISPFKREAQHEVNTESDNALWSRKDKHDNQGNLLSLGLETTRVHSVPDLYRIVVAVDPHTTTGQTGIVACGAARVKGLKHGYALEDASSRFGAKPSEWARQVWATAIKLKADAIVAEKNQGGEMVRTTLESVRPEDCNIPIKLVHASRGKQPRAEPVSAAFDDGRGHIVGYLHELEDELVTWEPGSDSPNRLDAMVWGFTELGIVGKASVSATASMFQQSTRKSQWNR